MFKYDIYPQDSWNDGSGIRKMRKFFKSFCNEFAEFSTSYHNKLGEFPFIYAERSLTSVVMPSLIKADPDNTFVFMEQPFGKEGGGQRFLDFYVDHGDNLYLIEMKHGWDSKRTSKVTDKIKQIWGKAHEQISDITIDTIKNMCNPDAYQNIFKIALLVMPVYTEFDEMKHELSFDSAEEYYEKVKGYFTDSEANWISVWKVDENKDYVHSFQDESKQFYPYVNFVVYQERIK